jgi:hypothetical protein
MDMETGACKVALEPNSDDRSAGKITDPEFMLPNNKYVLALAAQTFIRVVAKPLIHDHEIERYNISNTVE